MFDSKAGGKAKLDAEDEKISSMADSQRTNYLMACFDSNDPEVKKTGESAQSDINSMWKAESLAKFIQFGKDGKGEHTHTLNGPAFDDVARHPTLLLRTIDRMRPVYALLEAKKLVPELTAAAVSDSADEGPQKKGRKKRGSGAGGKDKKKAGERSRRVNWGAPEAAEAADDPPDRRAHV